MKNGCNLKRMFPSEEFDERFASTAKQLEEELRHIGIYAQAVAGINHPSAPNPLIHVTATIGDLAFSDRIQNPVEHELRSDFREVERETKTTKLDVVREQIVGDLFGDED